MKEATKSLICYRIERSHEALSDAKAIFQNGSLNATVNRIYYSMFYSVNALLLARNLSAVKHSGVKALFNREFINSGEIRKESGRFYAEIFEKRQRGDYSDYIEFQVHDVKSWLERAEEFVAEIEKLVNEKIK